MSKQFGLIGFKLTHSFSKKYFSEKFQREGLHDHVYELFELDDPKEIIGLIGDNPNLKGLNVTIPYKETIIPYLDHIEDSAAKVGAVNVIKIKDNKLIGYNSDYYGFKKSLTSWIKQPIDSALILGSGGASKAVIAALKALNIDFKLVSRVGSEGKISYAELKESTILTDTTLVVNTTPLGMYPAIEDAPDLPYVQFSKNHFVFDLVYNPEETLLLKRAKSHGARIKNGLEMLALQAEKSWDIWNS